MTGKPEELVRFLFNQDHNKLFDLTEHKEKRSNNANRLLWECLGELAVALKSDKWSIYLLMLKRYGKYTYICVKPNAVESMQKQWRESEIIGDIDINGEKAVQMLCYFGSSTYNTQEFSHFLDGVISEMAEVGLPTPAEKDLERAVAQWEKNENQHHNA